MTELKQRTLKPIHLLEAFCDDLDRRGGRRHSTEDQSEGASQREEAFLECSDRIKAIIEEAF